MLRHDVSAGKDLKKLSSFLIRQYALLNPQCTVLGFTRYMRVSLTKVSAKGRFVAALRIAKTTAED